MCMDIMQFFEACPECVIATVGGRSAKPLFTAIPVQRPFLIFGVNLIEFPVTSQDNKYVVVLQDFSKYPMVYFGA